jgi:hypothetical protein
MAANPALAIVELPLTEEERAAVLGGDMASLYLAGAHTFLLSRIPRFLPDLIDRDTYIASMRTTLTPRKSPRSKRRRRVPRGHREGGVPRQPGASYGVDLPR